MALRFMFFSLNITAAIMLNGCIPVAVMGTATSLGMSLAEERGVGGTISDAGIKAKINTLWLEHSPDLIENVELQVREGRVLLTGHVEDIDKQITAVQLCWKVSGVHEVIDETTVGESEGVGGYASDSWVTTQLKTELLFTENVESLNYNVKTVNGTVYLMGVAQNKEELDRVINVAKGVDGVKEVVSYVRRKDEIYMPVERTGYTTADSTTRHQVQPSIAMPEQNINVDTLPSTSVADLNPLAPQPLAQVETEESFPFPAPTAK